MGITGHTLTHTWMVQPATRLGRMAQPAAPGVQACAATVLDTVGRGTCFLGFRGEVPRGLAHPHREACLQCEQRRYAVKGPAPHAALRPPGDVFAVHIKLLASFTASFYADRNCPPRTEVAFRTPWRALRTCPAPERPLSVVSLHMGLPPGGYGGRLRLGVIVSDAASTSLS